MNKPIARNIDAETRILGFSPLEIVTIGLTYAILSSVLRGVPFSALLCLILGSAMAFTILTLNRICPPHHGLFFILKMLRPSVTWVMPLQLKKEH